MFIPFFLPDRPAHLHEREGDGEAKHFIGMASLLLKLVSNWKLFSRDLNRLECCIYHTIFEFRNLATMLFSSLGTFLEIPLGVLNLCKSVSSVRKGAKKNVMKLSATGCCNPRS